MNSEISSEDSDDLEERLRAQEQVLHDLQLAHARFLEKYREKMAQTTLPTPEPVSRRSE